VAGAVRYCFGSAIRISSSRKARGTTHPPSEPSNPDQDRRVDDVRVEIADITEILSLQRVDATTVYAQLRSIVNEHGGSILRQYSQPLFFDPAKSKAYDN
jgi:hypothetical protein